MDTFLLGVIATLLCIELVTLGLVLRQQAEVVKALASAIDPLQKITVAIVAHQQVHGLIEKRLSVLSAEAQKRAPSIMSMASEGHS